MHYKSITLIGTSHIAKQSIKQITQAIEKEQPEIVAVELDMKRYYSLQSKEQNKGSSSLTFASIRRIGIAGSIFALLGSYVQRKLGRMVGVSPGSDMLTAIKLAKKHKLKIALIDRDIEITLARFSKYFSAREKWNIIVDVFKAIFFKERELKRIGLTNIDLNTVPPQKIITKLMHELKGRYPNVYKVLVQERNEYMARKLIRLMKKENKKILVVLGAGHAQEVHKLLKKYDQRIEVL
jgi:pheromone shutdown-related protein TraB